MLHTRWSAEAWSIVRVEFRRALALRSEIRRAGWFNRYAACPSSATSTPSIWIASDAMSLMEA
jgi:hypothetical protein